MSQKSILNSTGENTTHKTILVDYIQKDKKFLNNYNDYKINSSLVSEITSKLDSAKMVVVSAFWCPDCRNNVPKMAKISEQLNNWSFEIMDRDDEGVKEKYSIKKIPTFIIYDKTGKELGRIIENPTSSSLEQDMVNVLKTTE